MHSNGSSEKHGRCGLCLREAKQLYSHLIPRAFYKHIRNESNEDPILLKNDAVTSKSYQVKKYFLCACCEDRFNRRGEAWVIGNYYRENGCFPIRDSFEGIDPLFIDSKRKVQYYEGEAVLGENFEKLVYFALSVFWRAAATEWTFLNDSRRLSLGPYEESLRQYLLDEGEVIRNACLTIIVSSSSTPHTISSSPACWRTQPYHIHTFAIPGILFLLSLGNTVPAKDREKCAINSSTKIVCLSESLIEEFMLKGALSAFKEATSKS